LKGRTDTPRGLDISAVCLLVPTRRCKTIRCAKRHHSMPDSRAWILKRRPESPRKPTAVTVRRLLRSQTRAPGDLSEERIIEVSSEDSEDDMAMNDDADLDSNLLSEYGGTISRSYRKLRAAVPRKRRSGNFSQVLISRMG
jgi:hypothetical protein